MRMLLNLLLPMAAALGACGAADDRENALAHSSEQEAPAPTGRIWGETDTSHMVRLVAAEIDAALRGRLVAYAPSNSADAGAHEEFHADGRWRGVRYSRGPIPFSGRWQIGEDRLCVAAESGYLAGPLRRGPRCREVWRDGRSGELLMEHAMDEPGQGLMRLRVRTLPPS